jgi:hypothetical protein
VRLWLVLLAAACSAHGTPVEPAPGSGASPTGSSVPPPPPVSIRDADGAKAQLGKEVTLAGTARDAKISAVVVADGNFIVYCLGLDSWPDEISGKAVVAHGTIEQTDEFTARSGSNGEVGEGTSGPVWVLRNCTYDH